MAFPLRLAPAKQPTAPRRDRRDKQPQPELHVVPGRRRVAWFVVTLMLLLSGVMAGVVYANTRVAERQLEIDRLESGVRQAQEEFDALRSKRAQLRAPRRLADEGSALGMTPGTESTYTTVDPMVLARVIAATGEVPGADRLDHGVVGSLDPLQQYRLVKQVASENS